MSTRRGFLWVCGTSTAGILCAGEAGGLLAASGRPATGIFDAATLKELAEQMREALVAMKPSDVEALRTRYGRRLTS